MARGTLSGHNAPRLGAFTLSKSIGHNRKVRRAPLPPPTPEQVETLEKWNKNTRQRRRAERRAA